MSRWAIAAWASRTWAFDSANFLPPRGSPLFEGKTRKAEPAAATGTSKRCAPPSSLRMTPPSLPRLKPWTTWSLPLSIPETSYESNHEQLNHHHQNCWVQVFCAEVISGFCFPVFTLKKG